LTRALVNEIVNAVPVKECTNKVQQYQSLGTLPIKYDPWWEAMRIDYFPVCPTKLNSWPGVRIDYNPPAVS